MSILRSEPPRSVESIEELFAIAHAMEHEAATRYAEMARRLRREGNPSLAAIFERLAAEERDHLASVVHWSEKERGKAPDPTLVRWKAPETFDDEGASTTDPRLLSAYRSLSMAVRNEERAFAFWTYVAAYAKDREIRRAAETMAGEELDHVAILRRERRRAYHADRAAAPRRENPDAAGEMAALERHLAERLQLRAAAAQSMKAERLQKLAREAIAIAEELTRSRLPKPGSLPTGANLLEDAATIAELLVEGYLELADGLDDEADLTRMQALAGRAINRLAWLRADLPELEKPSP
jgi:rubrerythrin